jgi:hypothetical protein
LPRDNNTTDLSIVSNVTANDSGALEDTGTTTKVRKVTSMIVGNQLPNFEHPILPHLDAAYNFARWLTRNAQDGGEVVKEACLRFESKFMQLAHFTHE